MAHAYLIELSDIGTPEPTLVTRLVNELEALAQQRVTLRTYQLAIEGVGFAAPLEHRSVRLRQLTSSERGRYWQSRSDDELRPYQRPTDFVVPREFNITTPSTLVEITTARKVDNRVALAFFLSDFPIASNGLMVGFDRPMWAGFGHSHTRSLVGEKPIMTTKPISQNQFEALVDLAYKMPEFGPEEATSQEVALHRALRGLGGR
jgi:hypothetical protein